MYSNARGKRISDALNIPVIGIGAGKETGRSNFVMHDMLGMNADYLPKFTRTFLLQEAAYGCAVSRLCRRSSHKVNSQHLNIALISPLTD